jgi:hypothetical protein
MPAGILPTTTLLVLAPERRLTADVVVACSAEAFAAGSTIAAQRTAARTGILSMASFYPKIAPE